MVKINPNFGYWKTNNSSGLKEVQFTFTSDGVTILKSAAGYDLTYSSTAPTGLTLTSTLNQPFVVFIFPSNATIFRPYLVKNTSTDVIGEINDNSIYTIKVPSDYNTVNFPAASVTSSQTFTFLIMD